MWVTRPSEGLAVLIERLEQLASRARSSGLVVGVVHADPDSVDVLARAAAAWQQTGIETVRLSHMLPLPAAVQP
jgi:polysaccharide deacetylase 2 family uncharacterized protein YibQ